MSEPWRTLLSTALGLGLLVVMFVPLERAFLARRQAVLRPAFAVDLAFFLGQTLVFTVVVQLLLMGAQGQLGALLPSALPRTFSRLPLVVQAVLVVALGDLLTYWGHRACHSVGFLWRFHKVHHSAEHLDWIAAYREHPLDGLYTQTLVNLPALMLGFPVAVLAPVVVFRSLWGVLIHSNTRLPLGPLGILCGDPVLHRYHHRADVQGRDVKNFANMAPYLDVVFGTHHRAADERYPLGLGEPYPRTWLSQLAEPFRGRRRAARR